jgi:hypothetical protein
MRFTISQCFSLLDRESCPSRAADVDWQLFCCVQLPTAGRGLCRTVAFTPDGHTFQPRLYSNGSLTSRVGNARVVVGLTGGALLGMS